MRCVILAVLIALGGAVPAWTQAAAPDGDAARVVLENEQVRVTEVRLKPGARSPLTGSPNRFVYGLSDGSLLFRPQGRTAYELAFKAGEAVWLPAESMSAENDTDKEIRALVVEIRAIGRPRARAVAKPRAPRKGAVTARPRKPNG